MLSTLEVLPATLLAKLVTITTPYLWSALHAHAQVVLVLTKTVFLPFSPYQQDTLQTPSTEDAMQTAPLESTIASTVELVKTVLNFAHLATWVWTESSSLQLSEDTPLTQLTPFATSIASLTNTTTQIPSSALTALKAAHLAIWQEMELLSLLESQEGTLLIHKITFATNLVQLAFTITLIS